MKEEGHVRIWKESWNNDGQQLLHMTIFISDPSLALGLDISARKPVGSRADEGSDMKKAM